MNRETTIDLRFFPEWGRELGYRRILSPELARALRPLPVGRELGGWAAVEALQQIERRKMAAHAIAQELTAALMEMVELADTENGYSRSDVMNAYSEFRRELKP